MGSSDRKRRNNCPERGRPWEELSGIWNVITLNQIIFLLLTSDFFLLTNSCSLHHHLFAAPAASLAHTSRRHDHMRVSYFDSVCAQIQAEHLFVPFALLPKARTPQCSLQKDRELAFKSITHDVQYLFHPLFRCHCVNSNKYNLPPCFLKGCNLDCNH